MLFLWIIIFISIWTSDSKEIPRNQISCNFHETINITSGSIDHTGQFSHNGLTYSEGSFAEFDHVISNTSEISVDPHIRGCICKLKYCIRVCRFCSDDDDKTSDSKCVRKNSQLNFPATSEIVSLKDDDDKYMIMEGRTCETYYKLEPDEYRDSDEWKFLRNGSLSMSDGIFSHLEYCFVQNEINAKGEVETAAFKCFEENDEITSVSVNGKGMLISLPFLLITFIVHACIPKLRNLHGKCLMSYTFGLMIFFVGLIVVNSENSFLAFSFECQFFGYMIYLGSHLCFFWLNVMCYEILSAFKAQMRTPLADQKQFQKYCFYAFGIPSALVLIVIIIDSTNLVPQEFRPQIGTERCWIKNSFLVESIYVYIPMSIILFINIGLYSITAYKITQYQKKKKAKNQKMDADKDKFFIYLRLFLMTGASWIAESISFFYGEKSYIFYVTDFLNCLQGVIIFILFVWKKEVRKMLSENFSSLFRSTRRRFNLHQSTHERINGSNTTTVANL